MEAEADQEWQPPSEAQMKIDKARRERSDKISKIMGDYLLKGYKMLGIVCDECGTILLQTQQGRNYCIACSELDSDTDKDNPVVNAAAALSKVGESRPSPSPRPSPTPSNLPRAPWQSMSGGDATRAHFRVGPTPPSSASTLSQPGPVLGSAGSAGSGGLGEACRGLEEKLAWATRELSQASSIEHCTQLCLLIKAAADALASLRQVS